MNRLGADRSSLSWLPRAAGAESGADLPPLSPSYGPVLGDADGLKTHGSARRRCRLSVFAAAPVFGYTDSIPKPYPPSNQGCYKELSLIDSSCDWIERAGIKGRSLREDGPGWLAACKESAL